MIGTVTDDRLWQTLQEKQQSFSYRMVASSFWPIVKEQVKMLPMIRRHRGKHKPEVLPAPSGSLLRARMAA
jgi:hypothetical protein